MLDLVVEFKILRRAGLQLVYKHILSRSRENYLPWLPPPEAETHTCYLHFPLKILIFAKSIFALRKPVILSFLFIYLCASTCVGELLKAPVLLLHFIEHRADNNSITFAAFIYQHYQDDDGNDQDNDRDSQLPFKSHDNSHSSGNNAGFPIVLTKLRFTPFSQASAIAGTSYKEPDIPSAYLSRIWQPPKFILS